MQYIFLLTAMLLFSTCTSTKKEDKYSSWPAYNGGPTAIKYSSLTQIDTSNVTQLKVAWEHHTGDADSASFSQIQCNPIMIDGKLFGITPQMKLFSLDITSGKEIWRFDANASTDFDHNRAAYHNMINSRGVCYWTDGDADKRIFFTAGSSTYAIDATTGKPISSFGKGGYIDLHDGLDRDVSDLFVVSSSPGIVYKDLLIMGSRVDENLPGAPGHIRAYDVRTGERKWIFHTIPHPGEFGYETWQDTSAYRFIGGANAWNSFSLDEKRGWLFAGLGSPSYDFYGGTRLGSNLFGNCIIALDANTGKRIWHFQTIHHDVWDKDLPTAPALVDIIKDGKKVEAVVQITKNAMVYVLNRETGKPIYDVEEVPVDTISLLKGEKLHPTQPIVKKPTPFSRQTLTVEDINPYVSDSAKKIISDQIKSFRIGSMFTPPGEIPSLIFPGFDGGGEWGGIAFDPPTGIMYVNANEMAWIQQVLPKTHTELGNETIKQAGERLFNTYCAVCHGKDKKGTGNNPTLINVDKKLNLAQAHELLNTGRRMMPAFKHISDSEKAAILNTLYNIKDSLNKPFLNPNPKYDMAKLMPYQMKGYIKFLTPDKKYPAISPPWGTLNAINLNTGDIVWKIPFGEYEELKAKGIPPTGAESYGGPVVTKGGVLFIAASLDGYFRAYNKRNGQLLWQYKLPAPGFSSPAVFEWQGKQYIVQACGGGKLGTRSGDSYIAFTLN